MNKQELIEKIDSLYKLQGQEREYVDVGDVLNLANQLNEPTKKVKVPQFVANYIEYTKEIDYHIFGAMKDIESDEKLDDWFLDDGNMELFARAWLDGYEVEKEPRYTVKVKSTKCSTKSLMFSILTGEWFFSVTNYQGIRFKHTRKQLEEADFGWVFDCPGIEIEEVLPDDSKI